MADPAGVEPATFGFVDGSGSVPASCKSLQAFAKIRLSIAGNSSGYHTLAAFLSQFAASLLLRFPDASPRAVVDLSRLLTVKEAAAMLNVCTATVYALVARGEIAHVRVASSIRIPPSALAGYEVPFS